jgi:hypothetical protein
VIRTAVIDHLPHGRNALLLGHEPQNGIPIALVIVIQGADAGAYFAYPDAVAANSLRAYEPTPGCDEQVLLGAESCVQGLDRDLSISRDVS